MENNFKLYDKAKEITQYTIVGGLVYTNEFQVFGENYDKNGKFNSYETERHFKYPNENTEEIWNGNTSRNLYQKADTVHAIYSQASYSEEKGFYKGETNFPDVDVRIVLFGTKEETQQKAKELYDKYLEGRDNHIAKVFDDLVKTGRVARQSFNRMNEMKDTQRYNVKGIGVNTELDQKLEGDESYTYYQKYLDIKEKFGLGDIVEKGTFNGVDWKVTETGKLVIGNGDEQTLDNTLESFDIDFPWYEYDEFVKAVEFDGVVHGKGSINGLFIHMEKIESIDFTGFETSDVTDMSYLLDSCRSLKNVNFADMDTSNVTDMSYLFHRCENLETVDVSNFNTSKVKDMSSMFLSCYALQAVDISGFDTSNVERINQIFRNCISLENKPNIYVQDGKVKIEYENDKATNKEKYHSPEEVINKMKEKKQKETENNSKKNSPEGHDEKRVTI